jgi:hypothetical protein
MQLQYQVMTAFDYLLQDNIPAAKVAVALLAVSIEQAALDNGRMDLATLLCLQEDPPSGIFLNRQIASTSRARSFAPLAPLDSYRSFQPRKNMNHDLFSQSRY